MVSPGADAPGPADDFEQPIAGGPTYPKVLQVQGFAMVRSPAGLTWWGRVTGRASCSCCCSGCGSDGAGGDSVLPATFGFRGASGVHGPVARIMRWVWTIQALASCSLPNPSIILRCPSGLAISTSKRRFE